ncbi:hypothetical protein [Kutzneria chonburiensis]|uniref:Uncharacterized protein n=1 Tax=Kutzneria chonburiensis TaxID=1483604 RepID=A0ABV6MY74_9PSEU|nr:hypothetical protein [Kutzneria chonburiensis]
MSIDDGYWLERWMREFDIKSVADYRRATQSPTVVKALYQIIPYHDEQWSQVPSLGPYGVMAGRTLDLSGSFHPPCLNCFRNELKLLLSRTAHYFQHIAVGGPIVDAVARGLEARSPDVRARTIRELQDHVALLLYIDEIGARDKIRFVTKPATYCQSCYRNYAREAGITIYDDEQQSADVIAKIIETSKFSTVRNRAGNWTAKITGPMVTDHVLVSEYGRTRPTRAYMAREVFDSITVPAVQDYITAKHYTLPIVDMSEFAWMKTIRGERSSSAESVALEVELPGINGIGLREFLQMQQEDEASYLKFQTAVRTAVREAIKRHESRSPNEIARAVVEEYVKPEIADIEQKMRSATRSLSKKVGISAVVGTTATSIGLMGAMPLVVTAGVGVVAASLTQVYKYFDDKATVESSDMYFLWKAGRVKHDPTEVYRDEI